MTTLEELDQRLRDAVVRGRQQTKLRRDEARLEERVDGLRTRVADLERAHEDEVEDVERLTSASLRKFVAILRGDLDEQLSAEEAEAARAATELAHARDLLAAEEERLAAVRQELDSLGDPAGDLADLRDRKEDAVDADSDVGRQLRQVAQEDAQATADLREVDEAITAGEQGLAAIGRAATALRSAGNWSTWDVMGGGGLVTMAKHSRLDDARKAGRAASAALTRFADEVDDVRHDVAAAPAVTLDGWDIAFDFFFDNIFTDLRVGRMIREAQEKTAAVDRRVRSSVDDLRRLRTRLVEDRAELAERRRTLLDPPTW